MRAGAQDGGFFTCRHPPSSALPSQGGETCYNTPMQLASNELARRTSEGSAFRHDTVGMSIIVGQLVSRDGHELTVRCDLSVRLVERDADLELFKEQLLSHHPAVTIDTIRTRLIPSLETTLRTFASSHDAETAIGQRALVSQLIIERANEVGFSCGLEFVPPIDATITCPSLEAKRAAERIEQDQAERLGRAAKVLQHARELGTSDGLRPDEQATLLQLLIRNAPPARVLIAAGSNLIELDAKTGETRPLPCPDIGALRCVKMIDDLVCVGGQRGVAIADRVYRFETASQRGINSVTIDRFNNRIIAAHGELGILDWDRDSDAIGQQIVIEGEPRNLTTLDDRIMFSIGDRLARLDISRVENVVTRAGLIVAILTSDDSVWVIRNDGNTDCLSRGDLRVIHHFKRSSKLLAAALIQVEGLTALALAGDAGPVEIVSKTGLPLLELHSAHQSLRMICHAGSHVVGISADRQNAVVWDIAQPASPAWTINLVARHGHRAADICSASA